MSDRCFVDSNILVYAHDTSSGDKHHQAKELIERLWLDQAGCISTQVLQEVYVNVRRIAARSMSAVEAAELIDDYREWDVVVNDGAAVRAAIDIEERYQISFWDALIIQAATTAGVATCYSEDLSHGQAYGPVTVLNPFAPSG